MGFVTVIHVEFVFLRGSATDGAPSVLGVEKQTKFFWSESVFFSQSACICFLSPALFTCALLAVRTTWVSVEVRSYAFNLFARGAGFQTLLFQTRTTNGFFIYRLSIGIPGLLVGRVAFAAPLIETVSSDFTRRIVGPRFE